MSRKNSLHGWFVFPCLILVLSSAVSATTAATLTQYSDKDSFMVALGGAHQSFLTFEEFEASTLITNQYPGVVFSSPNSDIDGYLPIQIVEDSGAVSGSRTLEGGSVPGVESPYLQIMVLDFSPAVTGFCFSLADYLPAAGPAAIQFEFSGQELQTLFLSNDSESETTPAFLGVISDTPIVRVTITSGTDPGGVFEEYTIDDVVYSPDAGDTTPPVCSGRPATESGVLGIDGTATDFSVILETPLAATSTVKPDAIHLDQVQTGILTVALEPGASNVTLNVTPFEAGASSVSFRATQTNISMDAQGTVVATDGAGNSCTLPVTFKALGPGPTQGQVLCSGEGLLFSVSNGTGTPAGTSACGAQLPGPDDPGLPPGYAPSPPDDPFPCRVLTIDSPLAGDTFMVLKKDGVFEPNLRMLYSESNDGGVTFPPFSDVTLTVEEIANINPDPTRLGGKAQWTPVKVDCALLSDGSRLAYCAGLAGAPGPDADGDGFTLCGSATRAADCSDQRAFINPGATELCNGLDDNCNGVADEGHPTEGADLPCTVVQTGLFGACTHGLTSCADGPMVCKQTVFPTQEIACNGVDDDCDGHLDEAYVFDGYLAPIKSGAPTVFLKKRGAIPFKFQLRDCAGANVANAVARIEVHFVANGVVDDQAIDIVSAGSANTDNLYRYDPTTQQYIYNLGASSLQSNSFYLIRTILDDGTMHDVTIGIK